MESIWLGQDFQTAAERQAFRVQAWTARNLGRALNIKPEELPQAPLGEQWKRQQVELGRSVANEYMGRIEGVLKESPVGIRAEELAKTLQEEIGFGKTRATLIAVNETLTLAGELNKQRQVALGLQEYVWSTSNDERVRSSHAELDGQTFSWNDPPVGGGTSPEERGHPGSGIRCRCVAIPVLK